MDGGLAAAGWYPDPAGAPWSERYWDGTAWTAQVRVAPSAEHLSYPPPTAPPPSPFRAPGPGASPWQSSGYQPGAYPPGTPGRPFAGPGPYGQPVVAPKNPALSLIVSFFIPGVGSMINGDVGTGIAILLIWLAGIVLTLFIFGAVIALGAWIWGLVNAYKGAQRWNARHGIIS